MKQDTQKSTEGIRSSVCELFTEGAEGAEYIS